MSSCAKRTLVQNSGGACTASRRVLAASIGFDAAETTSHSRSCPQRRAAENRPQARHGSSSTLAVLLTLRSAQRWEWSAQVAQRRQVHRDPEAVERHQSVSRWRLHLRSSEHVSRPVTALLLLQISLRRTQKTTQIYPPPNPNHLLYGLPSRVELHLTYLSPPIQD